MGMESIGLQDFHNLLHLWYEVLVLEPCQIWEKITHHAYTLSRRNHSFFFQSKQMLSRETSKLRPKKPSTYVLHAVDCTLYIPKIDIKKSMPKIDKKNITISCSFLISYKNRGESERKKCGADTYCCWLTSYIQVQHRTGCYPRIILRQGVHQRDRWCKGARARTTTTNSAGVEQWH